MEKNIGITLISLVITIIVLLILSGVTIGTMTGENGIITKAQEASFREEMSSIKEEIEIEEIKLLKAKKPRTELFKEQVKITDVEKFKLELKTEIIYWGRYEVGISRITKEYAKKQWKNIFNVHSGSGEFAKDLYYVDKELSEGENHKYIYDTKMKIVYKVKQTSIGKFRLHSIEELDYLHTGVNNLGDSTIIEDESNVVSVGNISHYEPDLKGFALEKTKLIYYNETDTSKTKIVTAGEYLNGGKQRTIADAGINYILYDYEKNKWANILVENEGIESYWVWIPRYAYNILGNETNIKFIGLEEEIPVDYILHSDFADGKKGIWVSKYEPTQKASQVKIDFPYYLPELTGFDKENTYAEVFDSNLPEKFKETKVSEIKNISKFATENKWFDYQNNIWANIKVVNPTTNVESWWVWIPRYAYNISGNETSIKFIDINNIPLSGEDLPSNYVVHPAFRNNKKGIWVSKYEPTQKVVDLEKTNNVNPPNLAGFNKNNTYLECYDEKGKKHEYQLSKVLKPTSILEGDTVKKAEIDYSKITRGNWYSYDKKIWGNIKVVNPTTRAESYWVWIPRYAYNITGIDTKIIFLDENGNPRDGSDLPSNFIPHPGFEGKTGIWASKYEPINK